MHEKRVEEMPARPNLLPLVHAIREVGGIQVVLEPVIANLRVLHDVNLERPQVLAAKEIGMNVDRPGNLVEKLGRDFVVFDSPLNRADIVGDGALSLGVRQRPHGEATPMDDFLEPFAVNGLLRFLFRQKHS